MRAGLAIASVLLVLCGAAPGHSETVADYDNFAPGKNYDLELIASALAAVPAAGACDRITCVEYSCVAVNKLHDELGKAAGIMEVILVALKSATPRYRELLANFQADYDKRASENKLLRFGEAWSRAFLTAGKLYLDLAGLVQGASAFADISELLTSNVSVEVVAGIALNLDRVFEAANGLIGLTDDLSSIAGKDPLLGDYASKALAVKSTASNLVGGLAAYIKALGEYERAMLVKPSPNLFPAKAQLTNLRATYGSIGQVTGQLLALYAELKINELSDQIAQNIKDMQADDVAFANNYQRYLHLIDRQTALAAAMVAVYRADSAIVPCAARCSEWKGIAVPPNTDGQDYFRVLQAYNPMLLDIPAKIRAAAADLEFKPGLKPEMAAAPSLVEPQGKVTVTYSLAVCPATQDAQIRLRETQTQSIVKEFGAAPAGEGQRTTFVAPYDQTRYELQLIDSRAVTVARAPLVVEGLLPEEGLGCVTLAKGMIQAGKTRSNLIGKSFEFTTSEPGQSDYVKARLTVSPGVSCGAYGVVVTVFAGVSRESEFFQLQVLGGDASRIRYLEQWITKITIGFDNGEKRETPYNNFLGTKVPDGAKRIDFITLQIDDLAHVTLTWGNPQA